jgi:hypothetical protein
MTLDLTDDEAHALAKHLQSAIDNDSFPFAPRLDPKAILANPGSSPRRTVGVAAGAAAATVAGDGAGGALRMPDQSIDLCA